MEKTCSLPLSRGAEEGIRRLEAAGFAAYAVGGCVRDALLGKQPHDFDLCTAAEPRAICGVFEGERLFTGGLRHGTVGVILGGEALEITSFRSDGGYSDGRHPDSVRFTDRLEEDLGRRDFTVNAMAYHPERGLVDLFGGQRDLSERLLRCVGEPEVRFSEDALRILRALRFSAALGFRIETETEAALFREAHRLSAVAPERIREEVCGLLRGRSASAAVERYASVLSVLFPGLEDTLCTETGRRTLCVLESAACPERVRLAYFVLLAAGGDAGRVPALARRLRLPEKTVSELSVLVSAGSVPHSLPELRRFLHVHGNGDGILALTEELLCAEEALGGEASGGRQMLARIRQEKLCFERNGTYGLALDGSDLIRAGLKPGREIGRILDRLLGQVTEEKLPNERDALLAAAMRYGEAASDAADGQRRRFLM